MNEIIHEKLKELARVRGIITYNDLNKELNLGLNFDNPGDRRKIGEILGEISDYEARQEQRMLSAVVYSQQDNKPGEGFFTLARELGFFHGDDELAFWINELQKVWDIWSSR